MKYFYLLIDMVAISQLEKEKKWKYFYITMKKNKMKNVPLIFIRIKIIS